jgi:hypothetical protein
LLVEDIKKACIIAGQEEWIVPEGKDKDNSKIERDIPF